MILSKRKRNPKLSTQQRKPSDAGQPQTRTLCAQSCPREPNNGRPDTLGPSSVTPIGDHHSAKSKTLAQRPSQEDESKSVGGVAQSRRQQQARGAASRGKHLRRLVMVQRKTSTGSSTSQHSLGSAEYSIASAPNGAKRRLVRRRRPSRGATLRPLASFQRPGAHSLDCEPTSRPLNLFQLAHQSDASGSGQQQAMLLDDDDDDDGQDYEDVALARDGLMGPSQQAQATRSNPFFSSEHLAPAVNLPHLFEGATQRSPSVVQSRIMGKMCAPSGARLFSRER